MEFCIHLSIRRWLMKDSTSSRSFSRANEGVISKLLTQKLRKVTRCLMSFSHIVIVILPGRPL